MTTSLIPFIRALITLQPAETALVQLLFKEKRYKKGDFFLEEGKICRYAGFIEKGIMRYYINHDGEEKNYGFSRENNFVCNLESFAPQKPSHQVIQALEDCTVFVISYADLQQFYLEINEGERFGRLVIEQVFIQTLQDLNSFYTDTPERRYAKFINDHPDLQQRISQYHIASYVGVKAQSLSRIRKRILKGL